MRGAIGMCRGRTGQGAAGRAISSCRLPRPSPLPFSAAGVSGADTACAIDTHLLFLAQDGGVPTDRRRRRAHGEWVAHTERKGPRTARAASGATSRSPSASSSPPRPSSAPSRGPSRAGCHLRGRQRHTPSRAPWRRRHSRVIAAVVYASPRAGRSSVVGVACQRAAGERAQRGMFDDLRWA